MSSKKSIERWLPIAGCPGYEVSSWGRVRSFWGQHKGMPGRAGGGSIHAIGGTPKILRLWPDRRGHLHVDVAGYKGHGGRKILNIARAVLTAFVRAPLPGEIALHTLSPDKTDNRVENLRWGTKAENSGADIVRHHGRHPCSPLAPADVQDIRKRLADGETLRAIAERYGVCQSTISLIRRGKHHQYIVD